MEYVLKKNKRIAAIVEARMTSSRLPGKHLMEVLGKPILGYLLDRLKAVESIDSIIVATTENSTDDVLVEFAKQNKVEIYRGDEDDVMGRVLDAAKYFKVDIICEVTGDCPIIDPQLVEQVIQTYLYSNVAYVDNGRKGLPVGMGAQVFSTSTLAQSESQTNEPLDREHVTLHINNHPEIFSHVYTIAPSNLYWPELEVTLDEAADFKLLKKIIEYFNPENPLFTCYDVISFLKRNPELVLVNQSVVRTERLEKF